MPRYEKGYDRGERVSELLRRILADGVARIGDEKLEFVTITGVKVDRDLQLATVYFSTLGLDPGEEAAVAEILSGYRRQLGEALRTESRLRRVPKLRFASDTAMHSGARVEAVLRGMHDREASPPEHSDRGGETRETPSGVRAFAAYGEDLQPEGFAVIHKETGCTSHDVVARARKLLGTRRVGHSGTLDPDATGVLVLGVGRATRLLRFITELGKEYEATVVFGAVTSTGDSAGEEVEHWDMSSLSKAEAEVASRKFVGEIFQVPPMMSALKVDGRRLHTLARQGRVVERKPRKVHVSSFEVLEFQPGVRPRAQIRVHCGAGTYIRSLAEDWGRALGGGAYLSALRRTAVGSFTVEEAHRVENMRLITAAEGLRDYQRVAVDDEVARKVGFGQALGGEFVPAGEDGPFAVCGAGEELLAVYERDGAMLRPSVVLPPGV